MERHEQIVPARFDREDALAGLRAIEQGGHAADGLGHAAEAASARFYRAHESVKSALQQFPDLSQTLRQASGQGFRPATGGTGANEAKDAEAAASGEWLDSGAGLHDDFVGRSRRAAASPTDEQAGRLPDGFPPCSEPGGNHPPAGSELSGPVAERLDGLDPRGSYPPTHGGPAEERSAGEVQSRAVREVSRRGFGGVPGPTDMVGRAEESATVSDLVSMPGPAMRAGAARVEPGESGRIAAEALGDYEGWRNADRGDGRDSIAAARRIGTDLADRRDFREGAEAWRGTERIPEGSDPREGTRRLQAAFPVPAPAVESLNQERATPLARVEAGSPPRGRDADARIGGGSTGVIERLLREQNELIKQDVQRNASPPIAAPPPMRGGGIRM